MSSKRSSTCLAVNDSVREASAFARAIDRPSANSLTGFVYSLLPNDTDFTIAREAGLPGLNLSLVDGFADPRFVAEVELEAVA